MIKVHTQCSLPSIVPPFNLETLQEMLIYFTHLVNAQFSKVHIFKQPAETPANRKQQIYNYNHNLFI